jgi:hypothetical protein
MIVIPYDVEAKEKGQPGTSGLIVILERDNMERMQEADPVTLAPKSQGGMLPAVKYPDNFSMIIAYEPEPSQIYALASEGRFKDIIDHVMRGYKFTKLDGKYPHGPWGKA